MNVGWFEAADWHRDYIESEHEIEFFEKPVQEALNLESYDAISVSVDSLVDEEVIEDLNPEKILCRSAGYDMVDLEAAENTMLRFITRRIMVPRPWLSTVSLYYLTSQRSWTLILERIQIAKKVSRDSS